MTEEWESEIDMDPERNKAVITNVIAQVFIRNHGEAAIMMAMAEMLNPEKSHTAKNWRAIVDEIERIQRYDKDEAN